ncbi:cytochrome P450 [Streptomyces shenzhenensis]|uniref:Cytochrome P450 n=1 Tax=Streptomyces shenzhenensis TaxID=943815 RepID=A0A3M0HZ89_9ACTN|nr:cytochrome P450 [Streptomyces shenzhenensis]RMB79753.1 cytochrome P450 [Streptomyces shenzhenensis]
MTTKPQHSDVTGLPVFPGDRDARCPLDPAPVYQEWRRTDGLRRVNWNGLPAWAVSRHEDVRVAMTDPRISAEVEMQQGSHGPGVTVFPRMDDPEHARLRRMLTKDFTVKRVQALRPEIEKMANTFIDEMVASGDAADLVQAYALPIPSMVISLLLGVPYSDHAFFQDITSVLMSRTTTVEEKLKANATIFAYLLDLIGKKEHEPDDAMISRVLREYVEPGELNRETLAMNGFILLNAGHETTANMIALGTLALLGLPDTLARIRDTDDPKVISGAVEELLRHLSIVHSLVARVATEDIEIGGQLVRPGELLVMNLPAANRDPAFYDDPDRLDIDRDTRGHMAFGHGVHQCLGQVLARAELEIALPTLLRRLPGLRLAVPLSEIRFRNDMSIYGVHELPVAW